MLDPVLLQTFLAIAQTRSFTQAAERLGLRQSTVSQHIRKLEEEAGRRLFVRDTHSVTTTADGEAMIEFARGILAANERAERYFAGSQLRGRLRFGASEDFVASLLPEVLREFVRTHPLVEFELTVGLSGELNEKLERGELDLVCGKRRPGEDRGRLVWRDRLAWVTGDLRRLDPSTPVPLILYSPPSITREIALAALERCGRPWRIVCTSGSLSGLARRGARRARRHGCLGRLDPDGPCRASERSRPARSRHRRVRSARRRQNLTRTCRRTRRRDPRERHSGVAGNCKLRHRRYCGVLSFPVTRGPHWRVRWRTTSQGGNS